jgi:hypothetical protein
LESVNIIVASDVGDHVHIFVNLVFAAFASEN